MQMKLPEYLIDAIRASKYERLLKIFGDDFYVGNYYNRDGSKIKNRKKRRIMMQMKLPEYLIDAIIRGIKEEVELNVINNPDKDLSQHIIDVIIKNDSVCHQFIDQVINKWDKNKVA